MITTQTKNEIQINNSLRYDCCPLCSSNSIVKVGNIEYLSPLIFSTGRISLQQTPELWACGKCQSCFTQNVIPERIAASLYEKGQGGERWVAESIEKAKGKEVIKMLRTIFTRGLRVLDIGCNTGELLDFAKANGCHTSGVEFCQTSREILTKKGHVAFSSISDLSDHYDVITAFDVLEHLYDLPSFLTICKQKLTETGRFVILTGNISSASARLAGVNWWYFKYPEHIVFPSRNFFQSFSGLQIEYWTPTYASIGYQRGFMSKWINIISGMLKKNYTGLPSLGPDHILAVLKK